MKIKKVSAILLAGALLTMGGVYATWTYGTNNAGGPTYDLGLTLTNVTGATKRGTLMMENATTKHFVIEQKAENDYTAALDIMDMTFSFTPAEGANSDVKTYGIPVRISFRFNNNPTMNTDEDYNYMITTSTENPAVHTTTIFNLVPTEEQQVTSSGTHDYYSFIVNPTNASTDAAVDKDNPAQVRKWNAADENGKFTYTLTKEEIALFLQINTVKLDTQEKHTAFSTLVNTAQMQVRIADLLDSTSGASN